MDDEWLQVIGGIVVKHRTAFFCWQRVSYLLVRPWAMRASTSSKRVRRWPAPGMTVPVPVRIDPQRPASRTGTPRHRPPPLYMGVVAIAKLRRGWGGLRILQRRSTGRRWSASCAEKRRQVVITLFSQVAWVIAIG